MKILQPGRTRIVGKGKFNERIQSYRTGQRGRKAIAHLNNQIYDRYARYCETIGSTPQIELMRENRHQLHEISSESDDYSVLNRERSKRCPTSILRKYPKHETVNFIKLKQYAKPNMLSDEMNERTENTLKKVERDFTIDLELLANESTKDHRIMGTITAIENGCPEFIHNPYKNHQNHLSTRFGILFYNDRIVIPENLREIVLAMLHQGHPASSKMEMASETFWWPGIFKDIRTKVENCTSCRMSGKNLKTQIPKTEKNYLDLLTEPNQEIQLDFAGPINSKSRGTLYILVAVDRFSRWPTAKICSRTDTKTVLQFLKEYCTENGTPRSIRTDNATCFKSDEFKSFCKQEYIQRIRSTPNLHTGTGLVERTIRTIKDLIRANLQDGLSFQHSLMVAIKTIRMTPNSRLKLTPFELHKGRKPRTPITNA